jgi:DNA-binding XRE family transcriptional regulator
MNAFRKRRLECGLSVEDLARAADLSAGTVVAAEGGKLISPYAERRLAHVLSAERDELFGPQTPGHRIRKLRVKLRMRQQDLAAAAGISWRTLTYLETGGTHKTGHGTRRKLLLALGLTWEDRHTIWPEGT